MIEAAGAKTKIVDGFEPSYGYRDPDRFGRAYETMTSRTSGLMASPERYRRVISAGFGLWLDYDWRKRGWKTDDLASNYFSPDRFESALRNALERCDEYVWIYTETPRWWSSEGKSISLPDPYVLAVRRAREGLCSD